MESHIKVCTSRGVADCTVSGTGIGFNNNRVDPLLVDDYVDWYVFNHPLSDDDFNRIRSEANSGIRSGKFTRAFIKGFTVTWKLA